MTCHATGIFLWAMLALQQAAVADAMPGTSKADAIEVCMPAGVNDYLARLTCSGGEAPMVQRLGSMGPRTEGHADASEPPQTLQELIGAAPLRPGQVDRHILDGFEVTCGAVRRVLYLDMYHCGQSAAIEPPTSFSRR